MAELHPLFKKIEEVKFGEYYNRKENLELMVSLQGESIEELSIYIAEVWSKSDPTDVEGITYYVCHDIGKEDVVCTRSKSKVESLLGTNLHYPSMISKVEEVAPVSPEMTKTFDRFLELLEEAEVTKTFDRFLELLEEAEVKES